MQLICLELYLFPSTFLIIINYVVQIAVSIFEKNSHFFVGGSLGFTPGGEVDKGLKG